MEERAGISVKFHPSVGSMPAPPWNGALQTAVPVSRISEAPRHRYFVELKPGETTFVSWKKLVEDLEKDSLSCAPAGANPALEARISPETSGLVPFREEEQPLSGAHRFRDVIQKIETLYQGADSDGEESDPMDEQYDTEDSFIDDEELNAYFAVEKSKLKHSGFYIHRGPLEPLLEESPAPVAAPKKRKRKDIKQLSRDAPEANTTDDDATEDDLPEDDTVKSLKIDPGIRMKVAARKVLTAGGAKVGQDKIATHKNMESGKLVCPRKDGHVRNEQGRSIAADMATDRVLSSREEKRDSLGKYSSGNSLKVSNEGLFGETSTRKAFGGQGEDRNDAGALKDRNGSASDEKQKEVSPGRRLKGTVLERAIQDLQKGVAAICQPTSDGQESEKTGLSGGKNKRLPRDIKAKLAKIARLSSKQGKIPREIIHRLMEIFGDKVRLPTLKYNLKRMVAMGITANQEKEGRLQSIKGEVTEMIKCRMSSMKAQPSQEGDRKDGSSDDFQGTCGSSEKPSTSGRYDWDQATEDRICDLYDLYVEGLDEHKGPKLRKLYGELASLWPEGWMDNGGIKQAVSRAKTRKKRLLKVVKAQNREELKKTQKVTSGSERQPKEERAVQLLAPSSSKPKISRPDNLQVQSIVKKELVSVSMASEEFSRLEGEKKLKRPSGQSVENKKGNKDMKNSLSVKRFQQQPLKMAKKKMRTGSDSLISSPWRKSSSSRPLTNKLDIDARSPRLSKEVSIGRPAEREGSKE